MLIGIKPGNEIFSQIQPFSKSHFQSPILPKSFWTYRKLMARYNAKSFLFLLGRIRYRAFQATWGGDGR